MRNIVDLGPACQLNWDDIVTPRSISATRVYEMVFMRVRDIDMRDSLKICLGLAQSLEIPSGVVIYWLIKYPRIGEQSRTRLYFYTCVAYIFELHFLLRDDLLVNTLRIKILL